MEIIETQRDKTYSELVQYCKRKFNVSGAEAEKPTRLRHYDQGMRVRMSPLVAEDDTKLFSIDKLTAYSCLDLETAQIQDGKD